MSNCRPREPGCQGSGGASEGFCMGLQSDTKASAFQGSTKKRWEVMDTTEHPRVGWGFGFLGFAERRSHFRQMNGRIVDVTKN